MKVQAGVGRTVLTPYWGVELTGWGYFIKRTWREVHDPVYATALVVDNGLNQFAVISVDLMVISTDFTSNVRNQIAAATGIPAENVLISCTHTHNAPAAGGLLGVGEVDMFYESWAVKQVATAAIAAWRHREPAEFSVSTTQMKQLTFNRTRENGPTDSTLTVLRVDRADGTPMSILIGFQAHPTVATVLRPWSVSRDVPGEICDRIESEYPNCKAIYLQGACGDVNFHRSYSSKEQASQPAQILAEAAFKALDDRQPLDADQLGCTSKPVRLPTRRWTLDEVDHDRHEAAQRLRDHDYSGWKESIGRYMTNHPEDMVARHGGDEWKAVAAMCRFNIEWTDRILVDLETRPEWLETEVQALRIGEFGIVSNASEFFTTLALDVRQQVHLPNLMLACYSNGRIGYLPDAYDVDRQSYASIQSPKYCNQFPFTDESGTVMAQEMAALMNSL